MVTDSDRHAAPARPGKRDRLIAATQELVHRQGVARTTLAEIAQAADVPVGNVYYYFKTKDEIVGAVVRAHAEQLTATLAELERRHRGAGSRLRALTDLLAGRGEPTARFGCPYGTLSAELARGPGGPDPLAATLMQVLLDWAQRQFRDMGRPDAPDLAVELVAGYEGAALLSNALGRPELMVDHARRLGRWVEALDVADGATAPG